MTDYDLLVLGSGNAGMAAAAPVAGAGRKVAIVERGDFGGTCALRGCVPKKVLVAAAECLETISTAGTHAIDVGTPTLDWAALIARERTFVEGVPESMKASFEKRGIEVLSGAARFVDRNVVEIGGRRASARDIVVAVGSKPRTLPFPGAEHLMTSDAFLEARNRPDYAVFVGGGVIAFELAHVLARAGTRVTILEVADAPLAPFDVDAVSALLERTRALGIDVRTSIVVRAVERSGDRYVVRFAEGGVEQRLEVDRALHGAGRVADLDALDLPAAGVDTERGAPRLDRNLRSVSNGGVWFAGDARGPGPQLSPVATYEGAIVAHNLLHRDAMRSPDYESIPACVFTVPTLATVGLTERQAKDRGVPVVVRKSDMTDWRSSRTYGERAAFAKILIEETSGRLVGAHLVGHGAAETIHAYALAMRHGLPASALDEMVYAYPTFHADIRYQL